MYLLDTDILIDLLRPVPTPRLLARVASIPRDQQFAISISLGELIYGARKAGVPGSPWVQRLSERVAPNLEMLPFDADAAWYYGEIRSDLERIGIRIGDADLRIAAIGRARDLVVVTGNVREFQRVQGLVVEDWLRG